jgi:beta-glucosidase
LLEKMTLPEKLAMLHGAVVPGWGTECYNKTTGKIPDATCAYTGNVVGNARLGIPPLHLNDGPQGFRENTHPGTTTQFPSGLAVAASWDVRTMESWGRAMGKEFFAKGANVQLGPGVCIARVPNDGRNFEYLSGEDPFLGFVLAGPAVAGIQSQKVIANAKHYVNNNQETNRNTVLEVVDERTRYEMYYPPFEGSANAGVESCLPNLEV